MGDPYGGPNRFMVRYLDGEIRGCFPVHEIESALWWAVFMRVRWGVPAWIDRERHPAALPA